MTIGADIQAEAFAMFDKWCEMFAPDEDRDLLEMAVLYSQAPVEQHVAAAKTLGLKDPRKR